MTENAKFKYSAQEGILELEGSEEFVSQHFERLTDLIRIISRHVVIEQRSEPNTQTITPPTIQTTEPNVALHPAQAPGRD